MSIIPKDVRYQNTKEVIDDRIPDLRIGPKRVETTSTSSLRDVFVGDMRPWDDYEQELSIFYFDRTLQDAIQRCQNVGISHDPSIFQKWPHYAAGEHTQIGEERDMQGRFLNNVIDPVLSTIRTLWDSSAASSMELELLQHFLLEDLNAGSAKVIPKAQRAIVEPDIVFKIPGSGDKQRVAVIGELKFSVTCPLGETIQTARNNTRAQASQKQGDVRHTFGQVARDMNIYGVRFGFVSTYDDTVFLKIVLQSNGTPALLYSEAISHTDRVAEALTMPPQSRRLSATSVRLGLLYLLHRASHKDTDSWSFNPGQISSRVWIVEKPNKDQGNVTGIYNSPNQRISVRQSSADRLPRPRFQDEMTSSSTGALDLSLLRVALPDMLTISPIFTTIDTGSEKVSQDKPDTYGITKPRASKLGHLSRLMVDSAASKPANSSRQPSIDEDKIHNTRSTVKRTRFAEMPE